MLDQVKPGDKIRFVADKVSGQFTVMQFKVKSYGVPCVASLHTSLDLPAMGMPTVDLQSLQGGFTMYELQVEGMTCGGCVRSVTRSVQRIDSDAKVDVDLKTKKVRVESRAGLDAITAAIAGAGYPVTASTAA